MCSGGSRHRKYVFKTETRLRGLGLLLLQFLFPTERRRAAAAHQLAVARFHPSVSPSQWKSCHGAAAVRSTVPQARTVVRPRVLLLLLLSLLEAGDPNTRGNL